VSWNDDGEAGDLLGTSVQAAAMLVFFFELQKHFAATVEGT
jgi:hypothetical protein